MDNVLNHKCIKPKIFTMLHWFKTKSCYTQFNIPIQKLCIPVFHMYCICTIHNSWFSHWYITTI